MFTERLSESLCLAGAVPPQTLNNTAADTGNGFNMNVARRAMGVINVGAVAGGGSLTCKFQASATSGGSFSDFSPAITLTTTTANKVSTLEVRADQMPAGKPFLKLVVTETGSQNVIVGAELLAGEGAYKPISQLDVAAGVIGSRVVG